MRVVKINSISKYNFAHNHVKTNKTHTYIGKKSKRIWYMKKKQPTKLHEEEPQGNNR